MTKQHETKVNSVANLLGHSDIVWTKYGTDTIEELAKKIVSKLENLEKEDLTIGE